MDIFISEKLSPDKSIVSSKLTPVPVNFPSLIFGDSIATNIYTVDGEGDFASSSGANNYSIKVGIGFRGETVTWLNSTWTQITDGWTGYLNLISAEMLALFNGHTSIVATLEVKLTNPASNTQTIASIPFNLVLPVIESDDEDSDNPMNRNAKTLALVTSVPNGVTVADNLVTVTGQAFGQVPTSIIVAINTPTTETAIFTCITIIASLSADGFQFVMSGIPSNDDYKFTFVPFFT